MSKPRGKRIQRQLAQVARDLLEPLGCICEMDFTKRGGHQQLRVTLPGDKEPKLSLEIPSSPRNEGDALDIMRQKVQRLIRQNQLA